MMSRDEYWDLESEIRIAKDEIQTLENIEARYGLNDAQKSKLRQLRKHVRTLTKNLKSKIESARLPGF